MQHLLGGLHLGRVVAYATMQALVPQAMHRHMARQQQVLPDLQGLGGLEPPQPSAPWLHHTKPTCITLSLSLSYLVSCHDARWLEPSTIKQSLSGAPMLDELSLSPPLPYDQIYSIAIDRLIDHSFGGCVARKGALLGSRARPIEIDSGSPRW